MDAFYYAHLVSPNGTVIETLKLKIIQKTYSISELKEQIVTFLSNERDDGNKLYSVTKVDYGWDTENVLEN